MYSFPNRPVDLYACCVRRAGNQALRTSGGKCTGTNSTVIGSRDQTLDVAHLLSVLSALRGFAVSVDPSRDELAVMTATQWVLGAAESGTARTGEPALPRASNENATLILISDVKSLFRYIIFVPGFLRAECPV